LSRCIMIRNGDTIRGYATSLDPALDYAATVIGRLCTPIIRWVYRFSKITFNYSALVWP
jgi:hypothetical protein